MYTDKEIFDIVDHYVAMWNSQNAGDAIDTYSEDVVYRDPGTGSRRIVGKSNLRRYLTRFFNRWHMDFNVLEARRLEGQDGVISIWDCTIKKRGDDRLSRMVRGMDIIMVRDSLVTLTDIYMDTLVLKDFD